MKTRNIERIVRNPLQPGFLGTGHLAASVLSGQDFKRSDPFILLMDDQLDLPGGEPVGGAHPHAGFETVTLVLEGDGRGWQTGSLELMTAGKGIVHTEELTEKTHMRIMQLWLALPPEKRWAEPKLQKILLENVPTLKTAGGEIRVYSGSSNGLTSPLQNHTPFTLVDYKMNPGSDFKQQIPASYNGFIYMLEGTLLIGETKVEAGETAWLDQSSADGESELNFSSKDTARFLLYAGKPHGVSVVSYGPFIADHQDEIPKLYKDYREGKMPHLNDLPLSRKTEYKQSA